MAAPTLTLLNHNVLSLCDVTTGWTLLTTLDTDLKKEGADSVSGIVRANGAVGYYQAGAAISGVGKTFRGWINTVNIPYMQPEASNGYELSCYDGSTSQYKVMFGSDTYFGGWFYIVWTMADFTSLTLANTIRWGIRANHTGNAKQVVNTWMDGLRYLDGYSMTGGTSPDPITLATIELADRGSPTLAGYGILQVVNGVYFCSGKMQFGSGATTTYVSMDAQVLVFPNFHVSAGLYALTGAGTGAHVSIVNSVIRSAGTTDATRFVVDFSDADLAALTFTGNLVRRAGAVTFKAGQTVTANTYDDCGQINSGGSSIAGSIIKNYGGTADTAALVWNNATDPQNNLANCTFIKGSTSTHAIEFGASSPATIHIPNTCTFSGYNAADGQTDSMLLISKGAGNTVDIYYDGALTYKSAGATVNIHASQATLTIDANVTLVGAEVRIYDLNATLPDLGDELAGTESCPTETYDYTGAAGNSVWLQVMKDGYVEYGQQITTPSTDQVFNIVLTADLNI